MSVDSQPQTGQSYSVRMMWNAELGRASFGDCVEVLATFPNQQPDHVLFEWAQFLHTRGFRVYFNNVTVMMWRCTSNPAAPNWWTDCPLEDREIFSVGGQYGIVWDNREQLGY